LVRQVLGAVAHFDKAMTVAKLRLARDRIRKSDGKCEGRKSHAEERPEAVALARQLHRHSVPAPQEEPKVNDYVTYGDVEADVRGFLAHSLGCGFCLRRAARICDGRFSALYAPTRGGAEHHREIEKS
jgi:hypothetical protein